MAVFENCADVVNHLCQKGVDINKRDGVSMSYNLKQMRTNIVYHFTSPAFKKWSTSLFMRLSPLIIVMLNFICMQPTQVRGTRN